MRPSPIDERTLALARLLALLSREGTPFIAALADQIERKRQPRPPELRLVGVKS